MVWAVGGFTVEGTSLIVIVQGKKNYVGYVDMLIYSFFLPEAHLIIFGDYLFQSDNASVHVSMTLKS